MMRIIRNGFTEAGVKVDTNLHQLSSILKYLDSTRNAGWLPISSYRNIHDLSRFITIYEDEVYMRNYIGI